MGVEWSGLQGYFTEIAEPYRVYLTRFLCLVRHYPLGEACYDRFRRGSKKWDLTDPGLLDSQDLVSTFHEQGDGHLLEQSLASAATSSPEQDQSRQCRRLKPMQISGTLTSRRVTVFFTGAARQSAPVRRGDRSVQKASRIADDCANGLLQKF